MKRITTFLAVLGLALITAAPATAAPHTVSISQIVEHPALDAVQNGFKDNLKKLGVDADFHVHIAQGNQAVNIQIASQILGEKPDLVLAIATPSAQACAQKIKDIPILFSAITDPVGAGLVKSLDKPGGDVSGMTDIAPVDRQVALIKEIQPDIKTVGVIYNAGEANSVSQLNMFKEACQKAGLDVVEATVANSSGVYQAAKSLVGKCGAVYIPLDNTVVSALESAVKVCTENKLPMYSSDTNSVPRGSIAALAVSYYKMGEQTAEMAKRILVDGAKIGDMPVEKLKNLELVINPKAAEAMGVTLPEEVLTRADKVVK